MKKNCPVCIFAIICVLSSSSMPDDVFDMQAKKMRAEYRECTGDTATVTLKEIMLWRDGITARTADPYYKKLLSDYIAATGNTSISNPCFVFIWQKEREKELERHESVMAAKALKSEADVIDSLLVIRQKNQNSPSRFDIADGIPFGISRRVFTLLFARSIGLPLVESGGTFIADSLALGNTPYCAAFHFDSKDRLYKYELEGPDWGADSFNSVVRIMVKKLARDFESQAGPADNWLRFGFFDVKSGALTPYATWQRDSLCASAGVGMERYRYYPKLIVTRRLP